MRWLGCETPNIGYWVVYVSILYNSIYFCDRFIFMHIFLGHTIIVELVSYLFSCTECVACFNISFYFVLWFMCPLSWQRCQRKCLSICVYETRIIAWQKVWTCAINHFYLILYCLQFRIVDREWVILLRRNVLAKCYLQLKKRMLFGWLPNKNGNKFTWNKIDGTLNLQYIEIFSLRFFCFVLFWFCSHMQCRHKCVAGAAPSMRILIYTQSWHKQMIPNPAENKKWKQK